jgi:tetratricopeptide (TPR) repeat protein
MPDLNALDQASVKVELADILLFTGQVWDASLLYQQVYKDYKNDEIGQLAKFRNARLSFYIGEFKWAKDQLDVLKAATTKLIANDAMALSLLIGENADNDSSYVALSLYASADLLEYRNEFDKSYQTLDSINLNFQQHEIFDDELLKKAEIRMKQGRYPEADTLLGTLLGEFPSSVLADKALLIRAKLNDNQLNDKTKAMQYYESIIVNYPGSLYVVEARKRFRTLRGDPGALQ